jgi:hypothetical protein
VNAHTSRAVKVQVVLDETTISAEAASPTSYNTLKPRSARTSRRART